MDLRWLVSLPAARSRGRWLTCLANACAEIYTRRENNRPRASAMSITYMVNTIECVRVDSSHRRIDDHITATDLAAVLPIIFAEVKVLERQSIRSCLQRPILMLENTKELHYVVHGGDTRIIRLP